MQSFPETLSVKNILSIISVHTLSGANQSFINRRTHAFVLYTRGECLYIFPYAQFTARSGELLFLPQSNNYSIAPSGDSDCLVVNFVCEALNGFKTFNFAPSDPVLFRTNFENAFSVWIKRENGYAAQCMAYPYTVISRVQQDIAVPAGLPNCVKRLRKAVAYIHAHYTEPNLRIITLANESTMCERTFRSMFLTCFHMPPIKYITRLRMSLAEELLVSQLYTVSEVAEKCGLRDVYYFSRLFKEQYGIPPSQYRKTPGPSQ